MQHHQHISGKHQIGHLSNRNLPKQLATCTTSGTSVVLVHPSACSLVLTGQTASHSQHELHEQSRAQPGPR